MASSEIKIDFTSDFFSVSKIKCENFECKYNDEFTCRLKKIHIDKHGICKSQRSKEF